MNVELVYNIITLFSKVKVEFCTYKIISFNLQELINAKLLTTLKNINKKKVSILPKIYIIHPTIISAPVNNLKTFIIERIWIF